MMWLCLYPVSLNRSELLAVWGGYTFIMLQRPFLSMFLRAQGHQAPKGVCIAVEHIHLWLCQVMQNCLLKLMLQGTAWAFPLFRMLSRTWYSHFKLCRSGRYEVVFSMPNVEATCIQLWSWASNLWLMGVDSPWIVFSPVPRVEAQRAKLRFACLFLCFLLHCFTSCLIWLFTTWVLKFPVFSGATVGSSRCPRPAAGLRARKNLHEEISCRALDGVTVGAGQGNAERLGSPLGAQAATLRPGRRQPTLGRTSSLGFRSSAPDGLLLIESVLPSYREGSSSPEVSWLQSLVTLTNISPNTQIGVWLTRNGSLAKLTHKKVIVTLNLLLFSLNSEFIFPVLDSPPHCKKSKCWVGFLWKSFGNFLVPF